jgi:hypothetical protein
LQTVQKNHRTKLEQDTKTYKTINWILAGVIGSIFLYSGFFAYTGFTHPLPSAYELLTGKESISTGLSRSFSAIMKLHLNEARQLNPHGISLFVYFLVQLFLRLFFIQQSTNRIYPLRQVITLDIILSAGWTILHFRPFIEDYFENLF